MKIGHCWLKSILPTRPPFYRRAVLIFQQENRGRKQAFHSPSPVKHWTIPPLRRDDKNRRRPAVLGTRGWSNWPERAGGHLQHGSGQICIRLCGLRWCRWWPDATASPRFCHCRVWVRVRQASRKNRRRSPNQRGTKEGRLAAKTCSRWNGSWLHRQTGEEIQDNSFRAECVQSEVCSSVLTVSPSKWLLESKQMVKWRRGQSLLCGPQCLNLWMDGSDGRTASLTMQESILF